MTKTLYLIRTNAYNVVVSLDQEDNVRFLTQNESFPLVILTARDEEDADVAIEFLNSVEDDSSWEEMSREDLEKLINPDYNMAEKPIVIAKIEKEM